MHAHTVARTQSHTHTYTHARAQAAARALVAAASVGWVAGELAAAGSDAAHAQATNFRKSLMFYMLANMHNCTWWDLMEWAAGERTVACYEHPCLQLLTTLLLRILSY